MRGVGDGGHEVHRRHALPDVLVAVQARHLLDEVLLDVQIEAPARHLDLPGVLRARPDAAAQPLQEGALILRRNHHGGQEAHPRGAEAHRARGRVPADLAHARVHAPPGQLCDERRGARRSQGWQVGVHAAFEAVVRVRAELVALGAAPHRHGIEMRDLQGDVVGIGHHAVVEAAHDARQPDRAAAPAAVGGGDDQVRRVEGHGVLAEQRHALVGRGTPHLQHAPLQHPSIVGVRGLAELEGDVVGDVHNVVPRAQPERGEAPLQPHRAGPDAYPLDASKREPGASHPVLDLDLEAVVDARVARLEPHGGVPERQPELGPQVARHAEEREGVRAVGRQFELDDALSGPQLRQRRTEGCVLGEGDEPAAVVVQAELPGAGQHPVTRDAQQLPLPHREAGAGQRRAGQRQRPSDAGARVGCAAHHLRAAAAVVRHHALQVVRARDAIRLDDPGHHHALGRGRQLVHRLDRQPQAVEQLDGALHPGKGAVEELLEPAVRDPHSAPRNWRSTRRSPW